MLVRHVRGDLAEDRRGLDGREGVDEDAATAQNVFVERQRGGAEDAQEVREVQRRVRCGVVVVELRRSKHRST
jgi:hypothetical protein